MDSPIIPFVVAIVYMLWGYVIKSNPNILAAISSRKKDVVSLEVSAKVGKQFIVWGLILIIADVAMYVLNFYRGYILLSIIISLLLICMIALLSRPSKTN